MHESSPSLLRGPLPERTNFFRRFPDTDGVNTFTIDKSPAFLRLNDGSALTRKLLPGSKIVLTLCDPAERMVSEYYHSLKRSADSFRQKFQREGLTQPADFQEFTDIVMGNSPNCTKSNNYCQKLHRHWREQGRYVYYLKQWLREYPADEILIINMDDPAKENAMKLVEFAGMPKEEYPWEELEEKARAYVNKAYSGRESAWHDYPRAMHTISKLFAPTNQELAELIGQDFPLHWNSTIADVPKQ